MNIGILTYGRVPNFGANLQSTSTYIYLQKKGHTPIYIYYLSKELYKKIENSRMSNPQIQAHYDYFDSIVKNKTTPCHSPEDVNREIARLGIEAIIIGADAVLQHHPFFSRIVARRRPFPIGLLSYTSDRLFPNLFWGVGIDDHIKMAMMSVSNQNSEYKYFLPSTRKKMRKALDRLNYISVRDRWTQKMIASIDKRLQVNVTPDPVFAFNQNMAGYIPTKEKITAKFGLPKKYIVISLFDQTLSKKCLDELKSSFKEKGLDCVVLPMPDEGVNFKHSFDYVIKVPLSPIDWYAIIKYSLGYVGENMHPIVVCLHNGVPCYSIDNWGCRNFFHKPKNNGSSKVEDILITFGVEKNRSSIIRGKCDVSAQEIVSSLAAFPLDIVRKQASEYYNQYLSMMESILNKLNC